MNFLYTPIMSSPLLPLPPLKTIVRTDQKQPKNLISTLSNTNKHLRTLAVRKESVSSSIFDAFDPRHVQSGNFSRVNELPPTSCEVIEGELPSFLEGAYFRNGPNPQFLPRGPYHMFDGDGMIHAIRISHGKAVFCSRYVKTYKYNIEKDAGFPIFPLFVTGFDNIMASVGYMVITVLRVLTGQFDPSKGFGVANTSLAYFGNKLYALWEADLPYAIKLGPDGDIITIGRDDFDRTLYPSMTAHPKFDPETKETFAITYGTMPPFLTFFRFNERGEKQANVPIFSASRPSFFHDFAITKNYAVFPQNQIQTWTFNMIFGGSVMNANNKKVPRLGVIRRYAKNDKEMIWFAVPGLNIIHVINAWEEEGGDAVVMLATNILSIEHALGRTDLVHGSVEKVRIDLKTRVVSRHPISSRNLEFGVINPAYVATKNRFANNGPFTLEKKLCGIKPFKM